MMVNAIGLPENGVPNDGYKLFITATVFIVVAGLFVAVRILVRAHKNAIGKDDISIVLSLVRYSEASGLDGAGS